MTTLDGVQRKIEEVLTIMNGSEKKEWFNQLNNWGIKVHETTHRRLIKQRKMNTIPHLSQELTDEAVIVATPKEVATMLYHTGITHTQSTYKAKELWEASGYGGDKVDSPILLHPPIESHVVTVKTDHMADILVERIGFNFILLPVVPQMNTSSPGDEYITSTIKTKRNNADLRYMPVCLYWLESDGGVIYGLGTHIHELVDAYKESEFALANSYNKALFYRYDIRIPYNLEFQVATDLPWARKGE